MKKVETVVIQNSSGEVLDRFLIKGVEYMEHQLHGNVLTIRTTRE